MHGPLIYCGININELLSYNPESIGVPLEIIILGNILGWYIHISLDYDFERNIVQYSILYISNMLISYSCYLLCRIAYNYIPSNCKPCKKFCIVVPSLLIFIIMYFTTMLMHNSLEISQKIFTHLIWYDKIIFVIGHIYLVLNLGAFIWLSPSHIETILKNLHLHTYVKKIIFYILLKLPYISEIVMKRNQRLLYNRVMADLQWQQGRNIIDTVGDELDEPADFDDSNDDVFDKNTKPLINAHIQDSTIEISSTCIICVTNIKSVVLFPCSHMVCCKSCSKHIDKCPVCRNEFDFTIVIRNI